MSDYSALTLIVYDCPDDQQQAVLDVIRSERLSEDYAYHTEPTVDELVLGERYGSDDARLDAYAEIAGILMTRGPGATFRIWNDPKYEWLGGTFCYTPDLGAWSHDCDADGNPVFKAEEVLKIAEMHPDDRRRALGLTWMDEMKVKENA